MIKAKKSLGQNFLIDRDILEKITSIVNIKDKNILEVGPGTGNLTQEIIKKNPKEIFLIEKDTNLLNLLKDKFKDKAIYYNQDILNFSEEKLSKNKITVFGNLPYNISTEILTKWIININTEFWFDKLILMFQKEFAERLISEKINNLNCLISSFYKIKKEFNISKNCFRPIPKVQSTVLSFKKHKNALIKHSDVELFKKFNATSS